MGLYRKYTLKQKIVLTLRIIKKSGHDIKSIYENH